MTTHLYLAPAAAGKTGYILTLARAAAQGLAAVPRVVVPSHLQARAARQRLAEAGGSIGVRVLTVDQLYAEILQAAGEIYVELSEPVQYRLLRGLLDTLPLAHYAPLVDRPGFTQVLQRLIGELKAGRVHPDAFAKAVRTMGDEPRLAELALIYTAYQDRLQKQGWADGAGLGWLAVEALETRAPGVARDWPLLAVDGFDNFTQLQIALLQALAGRAGQMVITLSGEPDDNLRTLAHRRFSNTRRRLEDALGIRARALPQDGAAPLHRAAPALAHLERGLFRPAAAAVDAAGALELREAPDRGAEVRAALRWLKARIVLDGCRPAEVALLARRVTPYRPFIQQTAAEFGLPIRLVDGLPLRENPAVAALLGLLRMALPTASGESSLPRRAVLDALRSPYFDWSQRTGDAATEATADALDLDLVARWGRVLGGYAQWSEALKRLAALPDEPAAGAAPYEERGLPPGLPRGAAAAALQARFEHFVTRITPPEGTHPYREFCAWLESLIGSDDAPLASASTRPGGPAAEDPASLHVVAQLRAGDATLAERDLAALAGLKDRLRGLVWAEEALGTAPVDFGRFVAELTGALDAASYQLPVHADAEEILVADVVRARGLAFRAVALLGLAEGEFPAALGEDPFLRDADRRRLRDEFGLSLELSTEGAEAEFFYETITRPREQLLLTRPRLADNGAPWQASPYWEAVRRLVAVDPVRLGTDDASLPNDAASWPELLESLAVFDGYTALRDWTAHANADRINGLTAATHILKLRARPRSSASNFPTNPFDGDLSPLDGTFAERFNPQRTWSASRLETYRSCAFQFFVGHVLNLEPREEPAEGLDARQLGNIYHHIFEQLYHTLSGPADLDALLAALPAVATTVLDDAPRREGFRATAWWLQSRAEIEANVRRSLEALAALPGDYSPLAQEAAFFGAQSLTVHDESDSFRVHGFIDRVDRAADGSLRIIDYKTAGPWAFTAKAVEEGKKLQVALYALAAERALGLGRVSEGFYWHVQQAEASKFTLAGFTGGPEAAIETALAHAWEAVRGARSGRFVPEPPDGGCPDYCPAAAFCWHYRPRR